MDPEAHRLVHALKARARELGFVGCGVADLSPNAHATVLHEWLRKGYAGTMRYLHRQAAKRAEPAHIVPGARRAVVLLENYLPPERGAEPSGPGPRVKVARYARGADYHHVTARRLEQLAGWLHEHGAGIARVFVDAGPVPERELGHRAGLGWIGKNTMLINPGLGSWFFLGSIFTDLELPADAPFEADRCGSCTRCLEACPTGALLGARELDATRCISYLTIEQKGAIPEDVVPRLAGWAFGCDVCNEVCPWNERFATPTLIEEFAPRPDPLDDPRAFDAMTQEDFDLRYADTPFERPGLAGMRRNWAAAWRSMEDAE